MILGLDEIIEDLKEKIEKRKEELEVEGEVEDTMPPLEEALKDPLLHAENHKQLMGMLGQHEMVIHHIMGFIVAEQAVISGIIGMLSRSSLRKDKSIKHELKTLDAMGQLLISNAVNMKRMLESESTMKYNIAQMISKMPRVEVKEEKQGNNTAYI